MFDNFVIGSEAPDEYIYIKDPQGNNKRVRKAKAKLATSLDEAASAAGDTTPEQATHKKREDGLYLDSKVVIMPIRQT